MEKQDREDCVAWLMKNDERLNGIDLDVMQVSKHLQGKTFKEIRNILVKVTKGDRSQVTNEIVNNRLG